MCPNNSQSLSLAPPYSTCSCHGQLGKPGLSNHLVRPVIASNVLALLPGPVPKTP